MKTRSPPRRRADAAAVLLSAMLNGTVGYFGTCTENDGASLREMLFWRFAPAALLAALFSVRSLMAAKSALSRKHGLALLAAAICSTASSGLYFLASARLGTGLAMVLFYTYPLMLFVYTAFRGRHRLGNGARLSILFATLGLALVVFADTCEQFHADGFVPGLASALAFAVYMLIGGKYASGLDPFLSAGAICGLSALGLLLVGGRPTFYLPQGAMALWHVLALGIIATAMPVALMLRGLRHVPPHRAAVLAMIEPVVTVTLGIVFLGEQPTAGSIAGMGFILAGATFAAGAHIGGPK